MPKPDIPPGTKRWVCAAEHAEVRAQLDELLAAVEEHEREMKVLGSPGGRHSAKAHQRLYAVVRKIRGQ